MYALIHWQAMRRNWRMQCLASLILPIAVVWFFHDRSGGAYPGVGVPLFIAGMLTLLLTVWRFGLYKAALQQVDAAPAAADEQAWNRLHHTQLLGLTHAKLPGWIGMLHYVCTMEMLPLILLVLASQGAMLLYRPAPQRFRQPN